MTAAMLSRGVGRLEVRGFSAVPLAGVSLLLTALAIAVFAIPGLSELLQLDRAQVVAGHWWRLFTGHITHTSFENLFWDVTVFLVLGVVCEKADRGRFLLTVPVAMVTISAAVLLRHPEMEVYRGLSGVDAALFALLLVTLLRRCSRDGRGRMRLLVYLAGALFLAKTAYEALAGKTLFAADAHGFVALPIAHLVGFVTGLLTASIPRTTTRVLNMFTRMTRRPTALLVPFLLAPILAAAEVRAADSFYTVSLAQLEITDGELPAELPPLPPSWNDIGGRSILLAPRVILDGPGEAFAEEGTRRGRRGIRLAIRAPADVTGRLVIPGNEPGQTVAVRFRIQPALGTASRGEFTAIARNHYRRLADSGLPGAAWFRYRAHQLAQPHPDGSREFWGEANTDELARELQTLAGETRRPRESDMEETFGLFTGARALSENLQLDRVLRIGDDSLDSVDVDSLPGITIAEYDWTDLVAGIEPELDPLARYVPADQHALFFPSFRSLLSLVDEADTAGTPVLRLLEDQAVDARTRERYEKQLCLHLNSLTRRIGPTLVDSVVFTGSDPYLRTGSDASILFEARQPAILLGFLEAAQSGVMQADETVERLQGQEGGLDYVAVRSPDRSICSYVASMDHVVLVTNSLAQVRALADVVEQRRRSLASLPEYRFFRERYPRANADETAFLMLSDATIRRWCGPRWRIGASRRIRAAAAMTHDRALGIGALAAGAEVPAEDHALASTYGNLAFQTPIAELDLDRVTAAEATAYERFRNSYQRNWTRFFDPIAVSLRITDDGFESNLTVWPLIASTDFRELVELTNDVEIDGAASDPHPEAIFHYVQAINFDSRPLRESAEFLRGMQGSLRVDPFDWIGDTIAVYIDADPLWDEFQLADDKEDFIENNLHRLPIALTTGVKNPISAAAFLTAARVFIEQAAPGMVTWETVEYDTARYVRITENEGFHDLRDGGDNPRMSIYYAVLPGRFVLTTSEDLLKRAINRARGTAGEQLSWPGKSVAVKLDHRAIAALTALLGPWQEENRQTASWRNLPILNEWRRLFPDEDPVAMHQRLFHQRLVCDGGGTYTWNDDWHTMESNCFGHPAMARDEPETPGLLETLQQVSVGLTFEHDGLRVGLRLGRK